MLRRSDDGDLMRKKREQWEREKLEQQTEGWFPFGSPGGGNPNKKHVARDYDPKPETSRPRVSSDTAPSAPQDPYETGRERGLTGESQATSGSSRPATVGAERRDTSNSGPTYPPQMYPPPIPGAYPYYAYPGHPPPEQFQYAVPSGMQYAAYPYPMQMLPPGTIPIAPPQMMTSSYTERWASQVPEWSTRIEEVAEDGASGVHAIPRPNNVTIVSLPDSPVKSVPGGAMAALSAATLPLPIHMHQQPPPPPPCPAAHLGGPPRDLPHAYVAPLVSAATILTVPVARARSSYAGSHCADAKCGDDVELATTMPTGKHDGEYSYQAQIEERRRQAEEEQEWERNEEARIRREREERESAKQREEQRKIDDERRKLEEREKAAAAVLEALAKAEEEAKLFKKMRLHRHSMRNDEDPDSRGSGEERGRGMGEREKSVLGTDDPATIEAMRKKVDAFERQTRLEHEEIARNAPPRETKARSNSLTRSPSISFDYGSDSTAAPPPSSPSPFRRAGSLCPTRGRRPSTAGSARLPVPPSSPAATRPATAMVSPFVRDHNSRYSLRGPPSPSVMRRPVEAVSPSRSGSSIPTGRPPRAPSRSRALSRTPSLPPRNSPASTTFTMGERSPAISRRMAPMPVTPLSSSRSTSSHRSPNVMSDPDSGRSLETYTTSPSLMSRLDDPIFGGRGIRSESVPGDSSTARTDVPISSSGHPLPFVGSPLRREEVRPSSSSIHDRPLRDTGNLHGNYRPPALSKKGREALEDSKAGKSQIPLPLPRLGHDSRLVDTSVTNPLFSPILTRPRRMRITMDDKAYRREDSMDSSSVTSADSGDSSSSEMAALTGGGRALPSAALVTPNVKAKSRDVPRIEVEDSSEENDERREVYTPHFSSRPSTPSLGDRNGNVPKSYLERMKNGGVAARVMEPLTPTVQPKDNGGRLGLMDCPGSPLSASMRSLRQSISNLNAGADSPLTAVPDSPGLSRFHSRTSQYRSFNTKRTAEKNSQLLDRLAALRNRLHATDGMKDRPLSRQASALSVASPTRTPLAEVSSP